MVRQFKFAFLGYAGVAGRMTPRRKSDGYSGGMRLHVFESCASREPWVDHLFHDRQGEPTMAAALIVKAASEMLVRFFLAMLDAWGRTDVKVLLRSHQEVTLTFILREVQTRC